MMKKRILQYCKNDPLELLLKQDWGTYVVGIPVIIFIIMLITELFYGGLKIKQQENSVFFQMEKYQKLEKKKL
jgi:hypothetical protein